eukprot:gene8161-9034_t
MANLERIEEVGGGISNISIFGMIRAQKLARRIKTRAIFLVCEKRKQENTGRISIEHTDMPQPAASIEDRPFTMQINIPVPRYLMTTTAMSTNRSPYYAGTTPSRLTSATQRAEPKVNTELYRMAPQKPFYEPDVRHIIRDALENYLEGRSYSPESCKAWAKIICDSIKEKVKALNFSRYKILCFVYIGQSGDHGVRIASMSLIDKNVDNFAEYRFEGTGLFAIGVVYGFYME